MHQQRVAGLAESGDPHRDVEQVVRLSRRTEIDIGVPHPVIAAKMARERPHHVVLALRPVCRHQRAHIFGQADIGEGHIMGVEDDALQIAFGIAHAQRSDQAKAVAGIILFRHGAGSFPSAPALSTG